MTSQAAIPLHAGMDGTTIGIDHMIVLVAVFWFVVATVAIRSHSGRRGINSTRGASQDELRTNESSTPFGKQTDETLISRRTARESKSEI